MNDICDYEVINKLTELLEMAERAKARLTRLNNDDMRDQIIETVKAKGYCSIWMIVFENDQDMIQRIIKVMNETPASKYEAHMSDLICSGLFVNQK